MAVLSPNISAHLQNQLTRSLERILEEAHQSGELKLSNRKLKDFPKAGSKYNLRDTVSADLSKNKFGELPEEIANFCFLEKLYCYHNVLRYLPDTIGSLGCLNYVDLSRNQLTSLPKEICQLPIQILLISNNRLSSLPDDLCRMTKLTEIDASSNQLTHLPQRMGDLCQLQSLNLRSNHLLCIPTEITFLQLVKLDLRANRIGVLPVEMKEMLNLMELYVDDNPLTSPPASLCKRGRVHIFKYLENEAAKLNQKMGTIASGTLGRRPARRSTNSGTIPVIPSIIPERLKTNKRQNVDSGYSTSSDDKRWSQEMSSDELHWPSITNNGIHSDSNTPTRSYAEDDFEEDWPKNGIYQDICDRDLESKDSNCSSNILYGSEDKKPLQQVQTYREYKEALKQQRAQDIGSIYRTKENEEHSYKTEPNTPTHQIKTTLASSKSDPTPLNSLLCSPKHVFDDTPSKNSTPKNNTYLNGKNSTLNGVQHTKNYVPDYVKPTSPVRYSTGIISDDTHSTNGIIKQPGSPNLNSNGSIKLNGISKNTNKPTMWNKEMTFTLRREIDKAREETDLINQLRSIIETRLKMILPEDLGPALTDGVVLCHLANHIKPRSVASIHVPSPAVPKLTMARCRRNVDNFLEACRKIGVDEENLCSSVDITEALEGRGLPRLLDTIKSLCHLEIESTEQSSVQTIDDTTVSLLLLAVLCITIVFLITNPEDDY